jgi:hypothetical protein
MTLRTCKHSLSLQPNLGVSAYWPAIEMFTINSDRGYIEGLN